MPQGKGGSLRCHTKVTGPEKEVQWERGAQPCWFKMLMFSMRGIQLSAVFHLFRVGESPAQARKMQQKPKSPTTTRCQTHHMEFALPLCLFGFIYIL